MPAASPTTTGVLAGITTAIWATAASEASEGAREPEKPAQDALASRADTESGSDMAMPMRRTRARARPSPRGGRRLARAAGRHRTGRGRPAPKLPPKRTSGRSMRRTGQPVHGATSGAAPRTHQRRTPTGLQRRTADRNGTETSRGAGHKDNRDET